MDNYWALAALGECTRGELVTNLTPSILALLYYDYFLTFTAEIEHFWKSAKLSPAAALFVIVRYYGLLGTLPLIVEYFADIPEWVSAYLHLRPYRRAQCTPAVCIL